MPTGAAMRCSFFLPWQALAIFGSFVGLVLPGQAQTEALDLDPAIVQDSPVLQRWLKELPDLQQEMAQDPSFRPRLRLGYNYFPSSDNSSGLGVGVEDLFLGQSPVTLSGDYSTNFGQRQAGGFNAQYYLLPLGGYFNITPLLGYRAIQTGDYASQGLNLGGKVNLALSRTGAADLSFSQSFVAPGSSDEVGIATLSVGYALTEHWRIATDLQQQNSRAQKDNRLGVYLEWMP
jgi:hypothetical protein